MDTNDCPLLQEVKHLVQRAQVGHASEVLSTAETRLGELGDGTVEGGPPAMHFPRVVALIDDDPAAGLVATEDMLAAAERDDAQGWRACALALRAAIDLGRLWNQEGRGEEAARLLSGIEGEFTEGRDTPDLQAACALLAAIRSPSSAV